MVVLKPQVHGMTAMSDDENERRILAEFVDEVRDTVASLQVLLENMRSRSVPAAEGMITLQRTAHNLKTAGHAVSSPLIKLITHRLTEYVADIKAPTLQQIEVQIFVDKIQAVLDGDLVDEADAVPVVRSLPAKRANDIDFKIELKNIEVLLVVPEKAMGRIVERELRACGYRTSNVHDAFVALETAARTQPDMIIASMELPLISGIDLICALTSMSVTEDIPCALLTSYDYGSPKLKGLPPRAGIIRKGGKFGDDLAEVLARFSIT